MSALSERLQLPLSNYIGGRGVGTITTIGPDVLKNVDDRFPVATQEMVVSYENSILFYENDLVYL